MTNDNIFHEGDTTLGPDSIRKSLQGELPKTLDGRMNKIGSIRKKLEKWAKENFTEVYGFTWEIMEGEGVIKGTLCGGMTRPELAWNGLYPVFEHEKGREENVTRGG